MKNKFNIDLVFLYQLPLVRDHGLADSDPEFDKWTAKYSDEYSAFLKFAEHASLEELLYIYIYAFREKTPDIVTLAYTLADTSEEIEETIVKYIVSRSDIVGFQRRITLGNNIDELFPEGRDRFDKELTVFLGQSYNINAIDEALQGLDYEKLIQYEETVYTVQDGVIDTLIATPNKIVITINDDKLVDYHRIFPRNPD